MSDSAPLGSPPVPRTYAAVTALRDAAQGAAGDSPVFVVSPEPAVRGRRAGGSAPPAHGATAASTARSASRRRDAAAAAAEAASAAATAQATAAAAASSAATLAAARAAGAPSTSTPRPRGPSSDHAAAPSSAATTAPSSAPAPTPTAAARIAAESAALLLASPGLHGLSNSASSASAPVRAAVRRSGPALAKLDYDLLGLFMGLTTPMDASASLHGALSSAKAWDVFVASMASLPTEDAIDLFSSMQAATAPAVIGGTYDGSLSLGGGGGGDGGGSPGRAGAGAARSKVTIVNASACCAHGKDMPPHMRLQGRPHAAAFTLSADRDGNTTLLVVDGAILSHVELAAAIREFMKDFHYQSSEDDTAAGASAREKWRSGMASAMSRLLTLFRVTDPFNHSPFLVTEADITALLAMMPATPGNVLAQACAGSSSADMATIATLLAKAPSEQLRSLELLFSMIPFVVHQAAFPHTFPVPPVDVAGMSTQDAETALAERGYREEARNTTPGPSHRFDALCGAAAAVLHLHNARLLQPVTAGFTGANPAAWIIATGINAAVDAASTAFYSASRGPSYLLTGQPACTRGCTDGDVPSPCREILHGAGQGWVNPLNLATASIIAAAPRAAISPAPLSAAGGGGGGGRSHRRSRLRPPPKARATTGTCKRSACAARGSSCSCTTTPPTSRTARSRRGGSALPTCG